MAKFNVRGVGKDTRTPVTGVRMCGWGQVQWVEE